MKRRNLILGLTTMALLAIAPLHAAQTDYTKFVDPTIGTGAHGHVFVGANVPFGFVQLGPTSIPQTWDWCSGYHISDSTVIGFSHTHLSGTGIGDLFDITVMPVTGNVTYARGEEKDQQSGLWSYSDRSKQVVRPGYYKTFLTRYGITAEMTATQRVGFHKYTFPASTEAGIVFDLQNGGCWDKATKTFIQVINDHTICGYRYSKGWANDQRIFFRAEFSKPFKKFQLIADGKEIDGTSATADYLYGRADFNTTKDEIIYVKVALSPTSTDNALKNLQAELPGWDFNAIINQAHQEWNKELSRVDISTPDAADKRIFYTSLYHTMVAPSVFCDVNGDYYGADHQMHKGAGFTNYTTFSLWDTYRAAFPLMTLIHADRMPDIINTMLHIYKEQGKLPVWHLMGCETDCMVGNPGIPVVADAVLKGFKGFDKNLAFEAIKNSAMLDERGLKDYKKYGYVPCDSGGESVAFTLEYALADWAAAQVAKKLGKTANYNYFLKRSKAYTYLFDPQTGFMRGRKINGTFNTPFNPFHSAHRTDDYCEGNAWQYTWLVPHDIDGLVKCFGSKEKFLQKLDSLFIVSGDLGKDASPDISGLIGQYAHGNEPSHHVLYFYTMAGQPWKTADKVRQTLKTLYTDQPDGISGNEDVGQMSSWYILSSMGFYQVEPAGGRYFFGSPLFNKVAMKVAGGTFRITATNNSPTNKYIQKVLLNGKEYRKAWIGYADIVKGGTLEFIMGNKQVRWY